MTRIAITMRTVDRSPGPNYLRQTLDNLRRAGVFTSPHLAAFDIVVGHSHTAYTRRTLDTALANLSRGLNAAPPAVTVHVRPTRLTPNGAATEAHAVADRHNADFTLFMEDDLDFCGGGDFLDSVVRWLDDHHHGPQYPLYIFGHVLGGTPPPGATARPWKASTFYGTQCYAVPRRYHGPLTAWLLSNPQYVDPKGKGHDRCHDLRLHNWARHVGGEDTNFLATTPSFVSHIGHVSGMGCPPVEFKSWKGRNWQYTNGNANR